MKRIVPLLFFYLLFSCEGSDTYQGKWKATDSEHNKFIITFLPNKFSIEESNGKRKVYSYTQTEIKYENSIYTYGIRLEDGRGYILYFPKKDESSGLIMDENGNRMFTINRNHYITYDDIYKLN